jgi:hypothetical protein
MNEIKKISIPVVLFALSGLFLLTSFVLFLHKGKSARWVARKMKIGGMMLSLTTLLNACDPSQTAALIDTTPPWTCYIVAYPNDRKPENVIYLESNDDSLIKLNLPFDNRIKGEIKNRTWDTFSFAVFDSRDSVRQRDNILASDGVFDENSELFEIKVEKNLETGKYKIRFFMTEKESQPEWSEQYFNLKIE